MGYRPFPAPQARLPCASLKSITTSPKYFPAFHYRKAVLPCFELHVSGVILWSSGLLRNIMSEIHPCSFFCRQLFKRGAGVLPLCSILYPSACSVSTSPSLPVCQMLFQVPSHATSLPFYCCWFHERGWNPGSPMSSEGLRGQHVVQGQPPGMLSLVSRHCHLTRNLPGFCPASSSTTPIHSQDSTCSPPSAPTQLQSHPPAPRLQSLSWAS